MSKLGAKAPSSPTLSKQFSNLMFGACYAIMNLSVRTPDMLDNMLCLQNGLKSMDTSVCQDVVLLVG